MRKSDFVVASLLIVTMVSTAQGQSIAERLKKAIKVSVKKPDSAAKSDPANQRPVDQASAAITESDPTKWPLVPDILGIRIGMSLDEVRRILSARPLGMYSETKSQLTFPADTTSFVDGMVSYRPDDVRNPSAGSERIGVLFTPPPGPARVVYVVRQVLFATDKVPRDVDFKQAVTTKYGDRSAEDPVTQVTAWLYPGIGTQSARDQIGTTGRCHSRAINLNLPNLGPRREVMQVRKMRIDNPVTDCGDQLVLLQVNLANRLDPPEERLVTSYEVQLRGYALGLAAQRATNALMVAAEADVAKKKLERAKAAKADTL